MVARIPGRHWMRRSCAWVVETGGRDAAVTSRLGNLRYAICATRGAPPGPAHVNSTWLASSFTAAAWPMKSNRNRTGPCRCVARPSPPGPGAGRI